MYFSIFEIFMQFFGSALSKGLLETFQNNNALLDQIMKCLEAYLESKRVIFPRFGGLDLFILQYSVG